jgi:DNA-binding NtrC family response regulator
MIPEGERLERPEMAQEWCDKDLEHGVRRALSSGVGLKEIGRKVENIAVQLAVEQEEGNLQRAARRLGVTDRALQLRRATELKSVPFLPRKEAEA